MFLFQDPSNQQRSGPSLSSGAVGIEVVLVIALSVLAMKFDRSQPLSEQDEDESAATGDATDGGDAEPTQQA